MAYTTTEQAEKIVSKFPGLISAIDVQDGYDPETQQRYHTGYQEITILVPQTYDTKELNKYKLQFLMTNDLREMSPAQVEDRIKLILVDRLISAHQDLAVANLR